MELSQIFDNNIYLLTKVWIYGGLFICGVLFYLLFKGLAIHRASPTVKENSLPIRPSMRTASEGPTGSSRRYPSKHAILLSRTSTCPRDAACNAPMTNRV
jgi:hypothetical protein